MPIPKFVDFDPDTEGIRADFEAAYLAADLAGIEDGGQEAVRRVALELQRIRPYAMIAWIPGPIWIIGDPENDG